MALLSDLFAFVVGAAVAIVMPDIAPLERELAQTYQVAPGSTVAVDIFGGRIRVTSGPGRDATLRLIQRVHTSSEREADAALRDYTVVITREGSGARLTARLRGGLGLDFWRRTRVQIDAELVVPADVVLDLQTSGGSIHVQGERSAAIEARTSGGSIDIDGGSAPVAVNTSGGSIRIGRTTSALRARTSGGSIRVDRVDASATDVDVRTSGGSVYVGVSPAARLSIDASTSGGRVSVTHLSVATSRQSHTHVTGALNGGGGRLHARTSGGSVRIEGR